MRLYGRYCNTCEAQTMFVEKLVNPRDPNCTKMEDVCMNCDTRYYPENKSKPKVRL